MTNYGLVECISECCLQIVFCHQSKQCKLFSLGTHVRTHACTHGGGVPSGPQHPGTTSLVTEVTDKKGIGGGGWIEGGKE